MQKVVLKLNWSQLIVLLAKEKSRYHIVYSNQKLIPEAAGVGKRGAQVILSRGWGNLLAVVLCHSK